MRYLIIILLLISSTETANSEETILTSSMVDIYGDGGAEKVTLVMTKGKKYKDKKPWCGNGDKYEGAFSIVVTFPDDRRIATELKSLVPHIGFFYSHPWKIYFSDYNHDGVIDFNLGQYSGCNGSEYTLFSFDKDGRLFRLGSASLSGHDNSTDRIQLTDRGYSASFYNNTIGGNTTIFYDWNPVSKKFIPYRVMDEYEERGKQIKEIKVLNQQTNDYETISRGFSP